jgi:CDP-diacylglycerol--glycerol-3-phosphate 3-phosphatidyltransferase
MTFEMNIKQIPNILSLSRILISISLFFFFGNFALFIFFYLLAGLTDVLDGYTARKFNAQSTLGAKLDSIGDLIFYSLLISYLATKQGEILISYLAFILIALLFRVINIVFGLVKYRKLIMVHTIANKLTGFLIFLLPIFIWFERKELFVVVIVAALLSPIEEFLIILRSGKEKIDLNVKGLCNLKVKNASR